MALPTRPTGSWFGNFDLPNRLYESSGQDYEIYEEDDEFVLSVEIPGFDPEDITVSWDDGILNVAGETEDEERSQRRTYHRRFRFPREVDDDNIAAEYKHGILEIRLPVMTGAPVSGTEIEVQG